MPKKPQTTEKIAPRPNTPGHFNERQPVAAKVPAWAMSLCLHVVIVLLLALWLDPRGKGTNAPADRPIGIAVAHRMADRTTYEPVESTSEATAESSQTSQSSAAAAAAAAPESVALPTDIDGLLADINEVPLADSGIGTGTAVEAGGGSGNGTSQRGDGYGPEATAMFFGVSGSGRRFVYVLDRSDSMMGSALSAAKRETIRSLSSLGPDHSFQIVTYNNRSQLAMPSGQPFLMIPASDSMKRWATQYVRAIPAHGGTDHYDAIKMALKLEPDVIFFLTDANIPRLRASRLEEVRVLAQRAGTTIHAVEFGDELVAPPDSFLRDLASQNGGQYQYIDVKTLQPVSSDAP